MQDIKKTIGTRINALLAASNKKQKDLAKHLGVTDNTVSYYVNGARMPNVEQIIKIAEYFDTTTDYLLGVSNLKTADTDLKAVCEYTGLSVEAVSKIRDIKASDGTHMQTLNAFLSDIGLTVLLINIEHYILGKMQFFKYVNKHHEVLTKELHISKERMYKLIHTNPAAESKINGVLRIILETGYPEDYGEYIKLDYEYMSYLVQQIVLDILQSMYKEHDLWKEGAPNGDNPQEG